MTPTNRWMPLVVAMLLVTTGCSKVGYLLYLIAPGEQTVKVPAEFDGLPGGSVAIVIYADQSTQYEYPYVRLELSSLIASEMKKNVKDVSIIDPRRVVKYQDDNINWEAFDRTEIGKAFKADYVLYISLVEYTTREPGSFNLFRGRIKGEVGVYKTSLPERQARVYRGDDVNVIYPEQAPIGQLGEDDSAVRYQAQKIFAEKLVKKFYEHEVPKDT